MLFYFCEKYCNFYRWDRFLWFKVGKKVRAAEYERLFAITKAAYMHLLEISFNNQIGMHFISLTDNPSLVSMNSVQGFKRTCFDSCLHLRKRKEKSPTVTCWKTSCTTFFTNFLLPLKREFKATTFKDRNMIEIVLERINRNSC